MRAGAAVTVVSVAVVLTVIACTGPAVGSERTEAQHPKVTTDGRLRPGHLEPIWVKGFDGNGVIEVAFFPGAICEDECSAPSFRVGRTGADGAAKLKVRMPGTFIDRRHRRTYFRDGERIEVLVTWDAGRKRFAVAFANPDPILVRTHGGRHD